MQHKWCASLEGRWMQHWRGWWLLSNEAASVAAGGSDMLPSMAEPWSHISPCLHPARRMTVIMMDSRWEEKKNKNKPTKARLSRRDDKRPLESVTVIYVSNKRQAWRGEGHPASEAWPRTFYTMPPPPSLPPRSFCKEYFFFVSFFLSVWKAVNPVKPCLHNIGYLACTDILSEWKSQGNFPHCHSVWVRKNNHIWQRHILWKNHDKLDCQGSLACSLPLKAFVIFNLLLPALRDVAFLSLIADKIKAVTRGSILAVLAAATSPTPLPLC